MKKEDKKNENSKDNLNDLIINEAVEQFKNGKINNSLDVENFLDGLLQPLMQKLLDTELENHLDYSKYAHTKDKETDNMRNGYCKEKKVKTRYGNINVKTPRDRNATFDPLIIKKGQTKLTGFEDRCISLYAKGMSLRDIEKTLQEMYGVKIGKDDISKLISAVNEETQTWQKRKLKPCYVFMYADCIYVNVKEDLTSKKKAIYVIIGIDVFGYKEIVGLWMDKSESASFWSNIFEELQERGVEDILYVCSDGIAGFKGSLERVYPKTISQRCVVHLVRNIYGICPRKDAKKIIEDYKKIYTSISLEEANLELEAFKLKYKNQDAIVKKVEKTMEYLEPLFELPAEIRKMIYTTNIIESVNSALRKVTRGKGSFPNDISIFKILYLRINELSQKWQKPISNWKIIQSQLSELFEERYTRYLDI